MSVGETLSSTEANGRGALRLEDAYRECSGWLRLTIMRNLRVQPADADDIIQDTWVRAVRQQPQTIEHPRAFFSQIALNLFRDRRRREAVREDHRRHVATSDASAGSEASGLLEQEAAFELERIILELPGTYRDAFVLSRFSHMTNTEIAAHLGISVKTVEWRIGKALELCVIRLRG